MYFSTKEVEPIEFYATKYDPEGTKVSLQIYIEHVHNEHERAYILHLCDRQDPLFLYTWTVSQTEYSKVQKINDLVVDFEGFPGEVKKIIQQCTEQAQFYAHLKIEMGEAKEEHKKNIIDG